MIHTPHRHRALRTAAKAMLVAASVMAFASCHKTCTCYGYDGTTHQYSADEVNARDTRCTDMVLQSGTRYYSYCTW